MQNSLVLFTFSVLEQKYPFWANLTPKKSSCQFKLKFGTQTNSSFQNSAGVFSFSVLDWKHSFWANLVQIVKIISLSLNLVPRLIRICRIQWVFSFFLGWKHPLGQNLVQKIKLVSLSRNLVSRLIRKYRFQWFCSLLLFQTGNTLFCKRR